MHQRQARVEPAVGAAAHRDHAAHASAERLQCHARERDGNRGDVHPEILRQHCIAHAASDAAHAHVQRAGLRIVESEGAVDHRAGERTARDERATQHTLARDLHIGQQFLHQTRVQRIEPHMHVVEARIILVETKVDGAVQPCLLDRERQPMQLHITRGAAQHVRHIGDGTGATLWQQQRHQPEPVIGDDRGRFRRQRRIAADQVVLPVQRRRGVRQLRRHIAEPDRVTVHEHRA